MAKKLIIGFLLVFLLFNMIMVRSKNKFFYGLKAHQIKSGLTNTNLVKEFEKKIHRSGQNVEKKTTRSKFIK